MLLLAGRDAIETLDSGAPDAPLVAVIPGADVALHRLLLTESDAAARLAEARMRATDLAAQPIDDLHLALGAVDADGGVWLALIDREAMAGHVAALAAHGVEPAALVPAAMLLAAPAGDTPRTARLDDWLLLRGADHAAAVHPALGPLLGADHAPPLFAPAPVPADAPNLLSGDFAPRRRWWRERRFQFAVILLAMLALALWLAPALLAQRQQAAIAGEHDAATLSIATAALDRSFDDAADAATAVQAARAAREAGRFGARLSYAAQQIAATPGARLTEITAGDDGFSMELGGNASAINALRARLLAGPFAASGDGTRLTLGDRRAAPDLGDAPAAEALARRIGAAADAAVLSGTPPAELLPSAPATEAVGQALAAAGLDAMPAGSGWRVDAARPATLLPLIVALEGSGVRFASLHISANRDQTVRAELAVAP